MAGALAASATAPFPQRVLLVTVGAAAVMFIVKVAAIEFCSGYTSLLLLVKQVNVYIPPEEVLMVVESVTVSDDALKVWFIVCVNAPVI